MVDLPSPDLPWFEFSTQLTRYLLSDHDLNQTYSGHEAQRVLGIVLSGVESALSQLCRKHSKLELLRVMREIVDPRHLAQRSKHPSLAISPLKYMTLAAIKYGNNKYRQRSFGKWPNDVYHLSADESKEVTKVIELCIYYDYITKLWNTVSLGASIVFQKDHFTFKDDPDILLSSVLRNKRLERNGAITNILSPAGTILPMEAGLEEAQHPMLIALAVVGLSNAPQPKEPLVISAPQVHAGASFVVRYSPQLFDLASYGDLARIYSQFVIREYGLSADELSCCLECLSLAQMAANYHDPGYFAGFLATGLGVYPANVLKSLFNENLKRHFKHFTILRPLSLLSQQFFKRMVLQQTSLRSLDMHGGWTPSFLYELGDRIIVDWVNALSFPASVLRAATSHKETRNVKGKQFESAMNRWISPRAPNAAVLLPPNAKLKYGGKVIAEVDLSFRHGNIGYIVDCKAYSVTTECLRGDVDAVNTRWSYTEGWISDAIRRAELLSLKPKGDNYELSHEVEYLIPVVCSPNVEPLFPFDDKHIIMADVPRVCTPLELVDILTTAPSATMLKNPYAFRVKR